ncbi:MAG: HTTM domain-containing protein [Tunicatimonas sp.]
MDAEGTQKARFTRQSISSFLVPYSSFDILFTKVLRNPPPTAEQSAASPTSHLALPYFQRTTDAAPLAVFRMLFGALMFVSMLRFWANGWIEKFYIEPQFFFPYAGLEFVQPLGQFTYLIFALCATAALFVALGYYYRLAIVLFFLSFTYIELMDKTTYLNHYYFVSVLSLMLIFLPAHACFSLDARRRPHRASSRVPRWTIDALKVLLGIVYCYAGLAKINSDWLLHAMPLKIWLSKHYELPLLGDLLQQAWAPYAFSWGGMLYDLSIPFLLLYRPTRTLALGLVVIFHALTALLFPIGMFPYLMIASSLIFLDASVHRRLLRVGSRLLGFRQTASTNDNRSVRDSQLARWVVGGLLLLQLLLPWRYWAYPGELFWTEEGYRFSWRVMLMEKAGYAHFRVVDAATGKHFYVNNSDFLTPLQEKQMATQPDFILQYAHYLAHHFQQQGHANVQVFVDSYVALNGRASRRYADPSVDLTKIDESFHRQTWLVPFDDTIGGL